MNLIFECDVKKDFIQNIIGDNPLFGFKATNCAGICYIPLNQSHKSKPKEKSKKFNSKTGKYQNK